MENDTIGLTENRLSGKCLSSSLWTVIFGAVLDDQMYRDVAARFLMFLSAQFLGLWKISKEKNNSEIKSWFNVFTSVPEHQKRIIIWTKPKDTILGLKHDDIITASILTISLSLKNKKKKITKNKGLKSVVH